MLNSRAVSVSHGPCGMWMALFFCSGCLQYVHIWENECVSHGCLPMFFKFLAKLESD